MDDLFFIFLPLIFFSVLVGFIGKEREVGFIRAFLLSLVVTPLIAAIMVLLTRRKKDTVELLADAKTYLDSGAVTKEEYDMMVSDITMKGKLYSFNNP